MGVGESESTIKIALASEKKPGQIWCEAGEHWVYPDEWMTEYDCCRSCYELRDKEWR